MNMYNRSVWTKEVDEALFKLINKTVYYQKENGEYAYVLPCFPMSDSELRKLTLPTVMIKSTEEKFDLYRYEDTHIKTSTNAEGTQSTMEGASKPYTLSYQIEFLSEYKEDMNDMLRVWSANIPKRFMLDVLDKEGNPRKCYMLGTRPSMKLDQHVGESKLYRTVFVYDIKVELDEGSNYVVDIVSGINLDYK